MAIEWDYARMTTGLTEIDEEHQEWIRRFNQFDTAVSAGQGLEAIRHTLSFLAEYAETHFAHEEAVAARQNAPVAALNRANHDQFRAQIHDIQEWIQQEGTAMVEVVSLKIDMEQWLINHICKVDTQLRPPQ